MNANIKRIIILGIAVLILGALVVALTLTGADDTAIEDDGGGGAESFLIYDKNPRDIYSVSVKNKSGEYTVERFDLGEGMTYFTVPEFALLPRDETFYEIFLNSAASMTAQQTISEDAPDLSIYGLSEPSAVVRTVFTDAEETVKEIHIGSPTPVGTNTYFRFAGENAVYTARTSDIGCFLGDTTYFLKKIILEPVVAENEGEVPNYPRIDEINISRKDIDYDIKIEYDVRAQNTDMFTGNSSSHVLSSPVTLNLHPEKANAVLTTVFGLTAASVEAIMPDEEKLAEYGLDDPYADIAFKIEGGDLRIKAGDISLGEDGRPEGRYCMVDGIDMIYVFNDGSLPWIDVMPLDITTAMITGNLIYDLESLNISGLVDMSFSMPGTGDEESFEVSLDGNSMDVEDFKDLYQFILRAPPEELYLGETSAEPSLVIEMGISGGRTETLEFIPSENRRAIIRHNGKVSFKCAASYVDRVVENLGRYRAGEDMIQSW